jgi:hypothetical protein
MFGMEIIDFELVIDKSMRYMQKQIKAYMSESQVGCLMQTWTIVALFDP